MSSSVPDLVARLVVRGAGVRRLERLGPVVGAQPDVGRVGLDRHPRRSAAPRRTGRPPRSPSPRPRTTSGGPPPGRSRSPPRRPRGRGPAGCRSARPPRRGWAGRRRRRPGRARADRRTARRPGGDRGAGRSRGGRRCGAGRRRSSPCPDRRRRRGRRAEPARMMASWSAWMVPSTSRIRADRLLPRLAMKADWSSSARVPLEPVRGEHLVPVVGDPAAGPAVPAAARQTHRVGVGRAEERLGRRGAPVEQQPAARAVGEAEPSDVHGLGVVRADDAPEAQVQAEAAQGAQAGGQPVDLQVPVQRLLADAAGRPALGVEAVGQVGDRLLEALRDGREVLLVAGDQRRVGLGARWSGRSNALVVRGFTASAPI